MQEAIGFYKDFIVMFTIVIFCSQDCGDVDKYVDKRSKLWISSNEAIHVLLLFMYHIKLSACSLIRIESPAFFPL